MRRLFRSKKESKRCINPCICLPQPEDAEFENSLTIETSATAQTSVGITSSRQKNDNPKTDSQRRADRKSEREAREKSLARQRQKSELHKELTSLAREDTLIRINDPKKLHKVPNTVKEILDSHLMNVHKPYRGEPVQKTFVWHPTYNEYTELDLEGHLMTQCGQDYALYKTADADSRLYIKSQLRTRKQNELRQTGSSLVNELVSKRGGPISSNSEAKTQMVDDTRKIYHIDQGKMLLIDFDIDLLFESCIIHRYDSPETIDFRLNHIFEFNDREVEVQRCLKDEKASKFPYLGDLYPFYLKLGTTHPRTFLFAALSHATRERLIKIFQCIVAFYIGNEPPQKTNRTMIDLINEYRTLTNRTVICLEGQDRVTTGRRDAIYNDFTTLEALFELQLDMSEINGLLKSMMNGIGCVVIYPRQREEIDDPEGTQVLIQSNTLSESNTSQTLKRRLATRESPPLRTDSDPSSPKEYSRILCNLIFDRDEMCVCFTSKKKLWMTYLSALPHDEVIRETLENIPPRQNDNTQSPNQVTPTPSDTTRTSTPQLLSPDYKPKDNLKTRPPKPEKLTVAKMYAKRMFHAPSSEGLRVYEYSMEDIISMSTRKKALGFMTNVRLVDSQGGTPQQTLNSLYNAQFASRRDKSDWEYFLKAIQGPLDLNQIRNFCVLKFRHFSTPLICVFPTKQTREDFKRAITGLQELYGYNRCHIDE